jgi:hypothetical protein
MLPMGIFPRAIQSPAVTGSAMPRVARRVDLDVVYPRPPLWAMPCQAVPHRSGHQLCAAWPSGSRREPCHGMSSERAQG